MYKKDYIKYICHDFPLNFKPAKYSKKYIRYKKIRVECNQVRNIYFLVV